ncbi:MAG: serine/threonine protein kinase [Planctomycetes bacterium]|nr:serine/threonine protein kinase [Planctomycetota bacterium]
MTTPRDEAAVEELLDTWFARRHRGQPIDLDELCAAAPQLRDAVALAIERHMALVGPPPVSPALEVPASDLPEVSPPPAAAVPALRLERLADYRIKRRIGRGGIGEVYLARQVSLDRLVAVKVLHAGYAIDPTYRLRFRREAEIAGALDHPHIVPIYETGEHEGVLFLVMKLVDGVPIDHAEATRDPLRLAAIGARVARALHAAHGVGVVHRDVKPANILVAGDHPFVVDFGLARGSADVTLTGPGQSPGTLLYMAPEQIRGGPPSLDPRVDVYGLGATLFHCLHGAPPFEASDPSSLLQQILFDDPPRRRVAGPARDLDVIARRALRKEPERRFDSALELAEDLERLAAGVPIRSRPVGPVERGAILARRHPRSTVALSLAGLACVVLGALFLRMVADDAGRQREQLDLARDEVAAGYPSRARARVLELPAARLAESDARQLVIRIDTSLRLEALLDELQAERRSRDLGFLDRLQHETLAGDPSVVGTRPAWVAQVLLASYADRAIEIRRLLLDPRASAFPRLSALLQAPVDDVAAALESAGDAADRADAALDAVAVAAVLRNRELDPARIAAELERPRFLPPRLVFGRAISAMLRRDDDGAAAMLGGLVDLDDLELQRVSLRRPHPEAQLLLGQIFGKRGWLDEARRRFAHARADLAAVARDVPLRLVLAEAENELFGGETARCREKVAEAAERWPGHPELALIESQLAVLDGDIDRALALSESACHADALPWTWRRAMAHWLSLRVGASGGDPNGPAAASIVADARELLRRSRLAFDRTHEASAEHVLAFLEPDPEDYVAGLERVLELQPGKPFASLQFVEQVSAWTTAGLPLAGTLRQRAERAVGLADALIVRHRAEPRCVSGPQLLQTTLQGARLAADLDSTADAKRLAGVAHTLLQQYPDPEQQKTLDQLARDLGIDRWPD